jgi:hypothetical protein
VLLSAPLETLVERLGTRIDNAYGKAPDELRRFLDEVKWQALLSASARDSLSWHTTSSWRTGSDMSLRLKAT